MKVIVSHDIDHITAWEHGFKDTILPKYVIRMLIEIIQGKISFTEFTLRLKSLFSNKWNHVEELITFNNTLKIPSHFFIGMQNGVGLSYSSKNARAIIQKFQNDQVRFGVHGIAFDNPAEIREELDLFKKVTTHPVIGMRMHYVRKTKDTIQWMDEAGYAFDSTEHSFGAPHKIGNMWEFPFQIMDSWVMEQGKKWQSVNLEQAQTITLQLLAKAEAANLPYLGVIFHDHYFSPAHQTWMNWYKWFMQYLKDQGYTFIRFENAIKELET